MNKTENINLGGYHFVIDEDAYQHLKQYLDAIRQHFSSSEGYEEIVTDIEIRIAEIFQDKLEGRRTIVMLNDVDGAISLMGTPEDFGAEADMFETSYAETNSTSSSKFKTGKRLYKNPDESKIDGVASGISAYFGIEDPVWIRIAFVVAALSGGIGIPLYIVLMIILPEAKSASDKLAMKGEPINVSNIAKTIEEEMEHLTKKLSDLGNEFKKKNSQKAASMGVGFSESIDTKATIEEGISMVKKVFNILRVVISNIIKPILFIVGVALIVAAAAYWLSIIIGFAVAYPYANYFVEQWQFPFIAVSGLLTFIIPVLMIVFLVLRLLFSTRINKRTSIGLWVLWFVSLSTFVTFGIKVAEGFGNGNDVNSSISLSDITSDTLHITVNKNTHEAGLINLGTVMQMNEEQLASYDIQLVIESAENDQFTLDKHTSARGKNSSDALEKIENITHQFTQEGNHLYLDPNFMVSNGKKWRAQSINYILKVPEGKTILFKNENAVDDLHNPFYPYKLVDTSNNIGTMKDGKMVLQE